MQEELEARLRNPKIRNVLGLYQNAENISFRKYLKQHFEDPLELTMIESALTGYTNPVDAIEYFEGELQQLSKIKVDPADIKFVEIFRINLGLLQEFFPAFKNYCISIADAIHNIASSKNINPEDIVENQAYLDEAKRKVFPRKEDYEEYHRLQLEMSFDVIERFRKAANIYKEDELIGDKMSELESIMPQPNLINKLRITSQEYYKTVMDRIYGK